MKTKIFFQGFDWDVVYTLEGPEGFEVESIKMEDDDFNVIDQLPESIILAMFDEVMEVI